MESVSENPALAPHFTQATEPVGKLVKHSVTGNWSLKAWVC